MDSPGPTEYSTSTDHTDCINRIKIVSTSQEFRCVIAVCFAAQTITMAAFYEKSPWIIEVSPTIFPDYALCKNMRIERKLKTGLLLEFLPRS